MKMRAEAFGRLRPFGVIKPSVGGKSASAELCRGRRYVQAEHRENWRTILVNVS